MKNVKILMGYSYETYETTAQNIYLKSNRNAIENIV